MAVGKILDQEAPVDSLQKQITLVNAKIDALYQIIEHLNQQLAEVLAEGKAISGRNATAHGKDTESQVTANYSYTDNRMRHKDVLADDDQFESTRQNGEKPLAPEIQIQRLTAQLTAAYNRIADLEERLLSRRMTSIS